MTTFAGQNVGAGQRDRCKQVIRTSFLLALASLALVSVFLIVFRIPLLRIFNSDESVVRYGVIRIMATVPPYFLYLILEVFSGSLRGFGYSLQPALISLFGICGTRIIWILTFFRTHRDFRSLMFVYPVSWLIASLIMIICYIFMRKKLYSPAQSNLF